MFHRLRRSMLYLEEILNISIGREALRGESMTNAPMHYDCDSSSSEFS